MTLLLLFIFHTTIITGEEGSLDVLGSGKPATIIITVQPLIISIVFSLSLSLPPSLPLSLPSSCLSLSLSLFPKNICRPQQHRGLPLFWSRSSKAKKKKVRMPLFGIYRACLC